MQVPNQQVFGVKGGKMPRKARSGPCSGYRHLIVRGIGKQLLFEVRADYLYYLSILEKYSMETDIAILAYCLMENHVHLLIFDRNNQTSQFMKKLGVSYSGYYNRKYECTGHLFQDRYLCENIDSNAYLLTVFRYILNNPQKAGICPASLYEWSSYALYDSKGSFVNTLILRDMIGSQSAYRKFISETNEDQCMEAVTRSYGDEWAKEIIRKVLHSESGTILQKYNRRDRNAAIHALKLEGLTNRQIERLTGISRNIVQRA